MIILYIAKVMLHFFLIFISFKWKITYMTSYHPTYFETINYSD